MIKRSWHLEKRRLDELKAHTRNPRYISKKDAKELKKSITKFGVIDKPIITIAGDIIGGHQRIAMLHEMGIDEIECWVCDDDKPWTPKEIDELNIRLNKNTGSWDFDVLANEWEIEDLKEWGFDDEDFTQEKTKDDKLKISIEINDENVFDDIAKSMYDIHHKYEDVTKLKVKK